jgi:hypothetical protein
MIAPKEVLVSIAEFGDRRSSKLAAPNDERLIEQTASAEIANEGRNRLIHFAALLRKLRQEIIVRARAVSVPTPIVELHESHPALDESTREQT